MVFGGVHPVTSMDDPRLRNPWAGVHVDVHSSHAQRSLKRNEAAGQAKPEKPGKPGGGGGGGRPAPAPGPTPQGKVYKAIIVGAGPGGW